VIGKKRKVNWGNWPGNAENPTGEEKRIATANAEEGKKDLQPRKEMKVLASREKKNPLDQIRWPYPCLGGGRDVLELFCSDMRGEREGFHSY